MIVATGVCCACVRPNRLWAFFLFSFSFFSFFSSFFPFLFSPLFPFFVDPEHEKNATWGNRFVLWVDRARLSHVAQTLLWRFVYSDALGWRQRKHVYVDVTVVLWMANSFNKDPDTKHGKLLLIRAKTCVKSERNRPSFRTSILAAAIISSSPSICKLNLLLEHEYNQLEIEFIV